MVKIRDFIVLQKNDYKLVDFLKYNIDVGIICWITESGYNLAMCLIDSEDLFIRGLNPKILNYYVVYNRFEYYLDFKVLHIEVKNNKKDKENKK